MRAICYHGTNGRAAKKILQEGFRPRTHFAVNLADALAFGGTHVFAVAFDDKWTKAYPTLWQFWEEEAITPDRIVEYCVYPKPRVMYSNKELGDSIFAEAVAATDGW